MKLFLRSFYSLLLIHSRRVVVNYKRKYVHKLLVNHFFKPAEEKVWLGELSIKRPWLLTWGVKQQNTNIKQYLKILLPL